MAMTRRYGSVPTDPLSWEHKSEPAQPPLPQSAKFSQAEGDPEERIHQQAEAE